MRRCRRPARAAGKQWPAWTEQEIRAAAGCAGRGPRGLCAVDGGGLNGHSCLSTEFHFSGEPRLCSVQNHCLQNHGRLTITRLPGASRETRGEATAPLPGQDCRSPTALLARGPPRLCSARPAVLACSWAGELVFAEGSLARYRSPEQVLLGKIPWVTFTEGFTSLRGPLMPKRVWGVS